MIPSPTPPLAAVADADANARAAVRLSRGVTATWWYTFSGIVFFEVVLVFVWGTALLDRGDGFGPALTVFIGGLVWVTATVPLLLDYRNTAELTAAARRRRAIPPLVVSVVYGVVALLVADIPFDRAQRTTRALAEALGVEADREGFSGVPEALLLDHQDAAAHQTHTHIADPVVALALDGLSYGPVVDGELIPRPPLESLRGGVGHDKPLVLGANDDEFTPFVDDGAFAAVASADMLDRLGLSRAAAERYLLANQDVERRGTARLAGRYVSDVLFRSVVPRVAAIREGAPARTWAYRFALPSPVFGAAVHCLDVPFFFDCLDEARVRAVAGPTPSQVVADSLHRAAVGFVARGDAGWAPWRPAVHATRIFDDVDDGYRDSTEGYDGVRSLLPEDDGGPPAGGDATSSAAHVGA